MHTIDLSTWERREHFEFFNSLATPQVSVTTPVDITKLVMWKREQGNGARLSDCLLFCLTFAANAVEEMRTRIVDGAPVIFDTIHAGFTYMSKGRSLHSNCFARYSENFEQFCATAQAARDNADERGGLFPGVPEGRDPAGQDMIYATNVNTLSVTALTNPWGDPKVDSVPRFATSRYVRDGDRYLLPLSIEVLHSLVDGAHVAQFVEAFRERMAGFR